MTPFETRLIEDMKLVGYSQRTQDTYLSAIRKLCKHLQKPVEQITNEELRGYLLWHKDKYAPNTTTIALCGVKFCFEKILKKPMPVFDLARQPRGLKLPVVLTREEVHAVLSNIRVLRHRACLSLIYSCGLRISEAVGMQVPQVDSKRMLIHVKEGKALSKIVAARFRDGLKKQAPHLYSLVDPSLWASPWVVHCQPVGNGQAALKYLATYIFRPAISNGRLLSLEGGIVSFRYQDSQTKQWKICRLEAIEFIRRYLPARVCQSPLLRAVRAPPSHAAECLAREPCPVRR
jgi:integrase